ncbi:MAG: hypothetical protein LBC64_06550 [Fibromonadaceae bacterium]|jgi:uncharacterized protein (TIGR02145 family)|nr:hypothetical protein [Fibromonadaceae bacterium]
MKNKLAKIVPIVLGFALIILLSCTDYQPMEFPILTCGNRTQTYDPDKYECRASTNPNGIYLKGGITDSRDGNTYDAVLIGEQVWMAQNLNYGLNNTGRCYDDDEANCTKYGRLYDWATAMKIEPKYNSETYTTYGQHTGICPAGWHIPNDAEWTTLVNFVGSNAGTKLKSARSWYEDGIPGTDNYGFAALPGGSFGFESSIGITGLWWSFTNEDNAAYSRYISFYEEEPSTIPSTKNILISVRCVKD